jgi:hypothetical protein
MSTSSRRDSRLILQYHSHGCVTSVSSRLFGRMHILHQYQNHMYNHTCITTKNILINTKPKTCITPFSNDPSHEPELNITLYDRTLQLRLKIDIFNLDCPIMVRDPIIRLIFLE